MLGEAIAVDEEADMRAEEIRQVIEDHDFKDHAEAIMARLRPALRLRTSPAETQDLSLGGSRMGGSPDLPPAQRWPENRGRPMEFLAQLDLAAAHRICPLPDLPERGWICAYCDVERLYERATIDEQFWRLTYFDGETRSLRRTEHPGDPVERFRLCAVQIEREDCVPDVAATLRRRISGNYEDVYRALSESINEAWDYNPVHRLGGYPVLIQTHRPSGAPAGSEFLLQIDTDQDVGFMWGDLGRVYFWITPRDLKARRFDRAWSIDQCY